MNFENAAQTVMGAACPKKYDHDFLQAHADELIQAIESGNRERSGALLHEAALPTPDDLLADSTKPEPYPLSAFPDALREAVEAIAEHAQAPLALAGQSVLGAITHLAQSRVNAPARNNPKGQPCSLFMLTLGLSGDRKSACRDLAFKVQNELEQRAKTTYALECDRLKTGAAGLQGRELKEYWNGNPLPKDPSTTYSDLGVERLAGDFILGKSVASIDSDEGSELLGGSSLKADTRAAAISGLCKAFDNGQFERMRARSNVEASGSAFNRRLSIHLLAQPVSVRDSLEDPLLRGQGFLPRFLFAAPESLAGTRLHTLESLNRSAYSDVRIQRFWGRYSELANTPPSIDPETNEVTAAPLEVEQDAWGVWLEHYNRWEAEQAPLGKFADMGAFASRGGQLAFRLATVLSFFEGAQTINELCMARACLLVDHSLSEWHRYSFAAKVSPEAKQAAQLVEWLKDDRRAGRWSGWFSFASLLQKAPPALRSAKKLRAVIKRLEIANHLISDEESRMFRLNPKRVANSANPAKTAEPPSLAVANPLRKTANESPAAAPSPANDSQKFANPSQKFANFSQPETQQSQGFSQNSQFSHDAAREVEKPVQSTRFGGGNA